MKSPHRFNSAMKSPLPVNSAVNRRACCTCGRRRRNYSPMSKDSRPSRREGPRRRPGSYAIARQVRVSPPKVRRVVDGPWLDFSDALDTLRFAPRALMSRSTRSSRARPPTPSRPATSSVRICSSRRPLWTKASPCAGSDREPRAARSHPPALRHLLRRRARAEVLKESSTWV